jgi:hypothetical protein
MYDQWIGRATIAMWDDAIDVQAYATAPFCGHVHGHEENYASIPRCILDGRLCIVSLDLYSNRIGPTLPVGLLRLAPTLRYLNMEDNQLVELPHWIDGLAQLQDASFAENRLERLPVALSRMRRPSRLKLNGNPQLMASFRCYCNFDSGALPRAIRRCYSLEARNAIVTALAAGTRLHRDLLRLVLECMLRDSGSPSAAAAVGDRRKRAKMVNQALLVATRPASVGAAPVPPPVGPHCTCAAPWPLLE